MTIFNEPAYPITPPPSSGREGPNGFSEAKIDALIKDISEVMAQGRDPEKKALRVLRTASQDAEFFIQEFYDLEEAGKATDSQFERRTQMMAKNTDLLQLVARLDGARNESAGLEVGHLSRLVARNPEASLEELKTANRQDWRQPARVWRGGVVRVGEDKTLGALFGQHNLNSHGFQDAREFFRCIALGLHDQRLQLMAATQLEGDGASGGFLVPVQFLANILDASLESEIVRPRADVVPMTSQSATAPVWDTQNRTADVGGLKGRWLSEATAGQIDTAKFRNVNLTAQKLAILVEASNELLQDASNMGQRLEDHMRDAAGFDLDAAFLNGTGAGMPHGVLNDAALISVAKESGQAADTIVYRNVTKMFSRMHPASVSRSVWIANSSTIPQLLELFASDGTTSTHIPVLREDGQGGFIMLTRPVVFTEKQPTLGDKGDIVLADFSQYVIGLRMEANIQRSGHIGFMKDTSHFRLILRVDGKGKWDEPVTPRNGPTQSWCVTLNERA